MNMAEKWELKNPTVFMLFHQKLNGILDLTNGPLSKLLELLDTQV